MTEQDSGQDARLVVLAHVEAFNEHSTARLLDSLSKDAVWATGQDIVTGRAELARLFDQGLWDLAPSLDVRSLVVDGTAVAAQLYEELTLDGERQGFHIAVFFAISDGLIRTAKVYREGSADIDQS
ncbi:MAG: nuclear transport factor 2 family protein [Pseudonocardiales bacterium]